MRGILWAGGADAAEPLPRAHGHVCLHQRPHRLLGGPCRYALSPHTVKLIHTLGAFLSRGGPVQDPEPVSPYDPPSAPCD